VDSLEAYLRGTKPTDYRSLTQFQDLLTQLSAYETNKTAAAALGGEMPKAPKKGLLSWFLGDVVGAPAKAVRGVVFGDPNKTGGDVLKVNEDDSLPEKAVKYAGALTLDIATDPLSYFGAGTGLGRKALATTAFEIGPKMLDDAVKIAPDIAPSVSRNMSNIVDNLFRNSEPYQRAAAGSGDLTLLGDAVTPEIKQQLAGEELGRIFGTSIYARSRGGAVSDLTRVFGDEEFVTHLIRSRGPAFEGGIWATNPATGKAWRRLTPGTGKILEPVSQAANKARFEVSKYVGRPLKEFQEGRYGGLWQAFKEGVDPVTAVGNNLVDGKVSLAQYANLKKMENMMRSAKVSRRFAAAGLGIQVRARIEELSLQGPKRAEDFEHGLLTHYHLPAMEVPINATEEYLSGATYAKQLHDAAFSVADEAYKKGLISNPPQWGYVPFIMEEEAKEARILLQGRQSGPGKVPSTYNPSKARAQNIEYDPDPKSAALKGVYYDERDGLVALSPLVVNTRTNKSEFLVNPIRVFETNYNALVTRIVSREFADEALRKGIVIRDFENVDLVLQKLRADVYRDAIKDVSPSVAARVKQARDVAEQKLREQLGVKSAETAAQQAASRARTQADLVAARANEKVVKKELTQVNRDIIRLRPTVARAVRRLRNYANESVELSVEQTAAQVRNAGKRVTRAQARADKTAADAGARGTVQSVLRDDAAQAELAAQKMTFAEQQYEVDFARVNRDDVRARFATEELSTYDALESLYQKRSRLDEDLRLSRRMLNDAQVARQAAWAGPDIAKIKNLEDYVFAYVRSKSAVKELEIKYGFEIRDSIAETVKDSNWYKKLLTSPILKARDTITESVRANYLERRRIAALAEQEMKRVLGIAKEGRPDTLLADYADTLVKLSDEMSDADLVNTMVFTSDERLARLLDEFDTAPSELARDVAAGRIMQVYGFIRNFASNADLEKMAAAEKAMLGTVPVDAVKAEMAGILKAEHLRKRGYGPIAPLDSAVIVPVGLENVFVADGIREFLEKAYRVENDPTSVKKFVEQTVEPLLLLWKAGVTVLRGPAYTVTNAGGIILHNYYQGTPIKDLAKHARFFADMSQIFRSKDLKTKDIYTRLTETRVQMALKWGDVKFGDMSVVDLFEHYILGSGAADTQMADVMRRLGQQGGDIPIDEITGMPVKYTSVNDTIDRAKRGRFGNSLDSTINMVLGNRLSLAVVDANQMVELWGRFASYAKAYQDYGNLDVALQISDLYHFNYQNLSDAEKAVRRFIPFYAWTRNNVPLQIRAMLLQPAKINRFLYAQEEAGKVIGPDEDDQWLNAVLPSYIAEVGGFVTGFETDAGNLAYANRLPFSDIDRLFRAGVLPVNMRELSNMIGPAALPLQMLQGTNPATGAAFNPMGTEAPGYLKWLQYTGVGQRGKEGEYRLPDPLFYALTETIPFIGTAERGVSGLAALVDAAGAESVAGALNKIPSRASAEKGVSNLLNITGISATLGGSFGTLTPRAINSEVRRRNTQLNAKLYDLAAKEGVSLEWVKEQLRAGRTPEQVQQLIKSGQGKREEYEAQKISKSRGVSQRSLDIIARMGQE